MSREIIPTNRSECVQGHLFCGKLESVNLKFYQKYPNIGDQFSLAVAQHYFSPQVTACDESALTIPNVILIGSFLHYADACSHICGAGFIASDPKYKLRAAPKSINCVRGPLTGHLLEKQGATDPHLYADPGILAPAIYPQNAWSCGGTIGLVAHYVDAESPWIELCRKKGLKIIDVFSPPDKFFAQINQCEAILSSSLHGIIFAHAYGKPALWIELSDNIIGGGFKFYDYYMSVGVRPEKVRRVRVTENTDPCEIAKSATIEEHAKLHASLKEAMDMTIQKLKHDTPKLSDARNTSNPLVCNNTQKTDGVVKLHIACGRHYLDGWVNIDGDPKTQADIHCDITREGLPFPDNSVDYVFNEHFIEHLSYEDGLAFFKEAYRVLKSDGVLRIAFPDLRTLIDSYIHDDWREMEWVKLIDAQWYPSGCFMLNRCIREKGLHKYMYDVEEVQRRLSEAGFCSTTVCQVKQSNYPQLQQAERRADSSVVEAVKAGVPLMDDMLTVILLTYNHEATISRAFDSILEQETGFNFNIFVLEDCSTDRTAQICKDYQTKYPGKIKLFLNERNLGPAQNYKNGLLKVTAKYYAFLEGDDYWCNKKKLQKQVAALEANPDCTMAGHDTLYKDLVEHKEKTFRSMFNIGLKTKYSVHDKFRVHLSSRVYRNIIDLTKVPDFMFFDTRQYLLYLSKGKLFYIDEIMSVYNKTGTGFWSGMSECDRKRLVLDLDDKTKKYFDSLKAIEKRAELAENHDDSKLSSDKTLELFRRAQCEFEMGNMVTALQHIRQYQNNPCYDRLNPVFAETRKPKPLFSVIAVTHNRPEDVNLCIDSLRQQEFNDYEVIIVDNGDADKKAAALAGQVDVYVGCSINFNPSEARNIGAHFAKGEILVFLDDDALVGPDYLVSIQKAFKQYEILGLRGKILPKNLHELSDRVTIYDLGDKPMSSLSTIEGNTAFRRDAYLAVGGMDALLFGHEGIDLSYRLMQLSGSRSSVIYWPEATIYHDYGNANQFAEKKDRYDRNRNYLKYKYDVDVIGLKEEIQASPLKSNQSGRLLPPFPVIQQPATAVKAEVDGPKVSIVMACRNAAEFLAETMDSILAQTLKDWELLATDDGSTDQTRAILESYAAKDARIRLGFFDDPKGPYVRRNFAIKQAKAPFICIQDADDLMATNKLEILYDQINQDQRLGVVGSFYRRFLDTFRGTDFGDRMEKRITHDELMEAFGGCWHLCWHGSAIIRKSLFETIGLYDEQPYGSDTFWLSKAGLYGFLTGQIRFKNLPECLTYKREHAQSQTGKISPADPRSRRHRLERYYLQKLRQIAGEAKANPSMDVAPKIRECTCTDFIPRFEHLFDQWESVPVNETMIQGLINRGLSQFSSEQYVSALITLNCLDRMTSGGCQSYRNLNFTRGLAYYACGDDQQAAANIQKEIQCFENQHAQAFLARYLTTTGVAVSAADRRANIRRFVDEASQNATPTAVSPPQETPPNDSFDLQERLALAKHYLFNGKSEEALGVYRGILSDNKMAGQVELKEKLAKLVEGIRLAKIAQASSQTGFNFAESGK